jgi:uncharacterized membrane protein
MFQILIPLCLLSNGLTAGGLLVSVVGVAPVRLALPADRAVRLHQLLLPRLEPLMPALLVAGAVLDGVAGFYAPTTATHVLCVVASSLQLKAILVAVAKNAPINRRLAALDADALPADFAETDPRETWRRWNTVRAVLVIASLAVNVVVVGLLV